MGRSSRSPAPMQFPNIIPSIRGLTSVDGNSWRDRIESRSPPGDLGPSGAIAGSTEAGTCVGFCRRATVDSRIGPTDAEGELAHFGQSCKQGFKHAPTRLAEYATAESDFTNENRAARPLYARSGATRDRVSRPGWPVNHTEAPFTTLRCRVTGPRSPDEGFHTREWAIWRPRTSGLVWTGGRRVAPTFLADPAA